MSKNIKDNIRHDEGERGFAIVVVLAILMTLTVLAIGVLTSSTTNSAMSRNFEKNKQAIKEFGLNEREVRVVLLGLGFPLVACRSFDPTRGVRRCLQKK